MIFDSTIWHHLWWRWRSLSRIHFMVESHATRVQAKTDRLCNLGRGYVGCPGNCNLKSLLWKRLWSQGQKALDIAFLVANIMANPRETFLHDDYNTQRMKQHFRNTHSRHERPPSGRTYWVMTRWFRYQKVLLGGGGSWSRNWTQWIFYYIKLLHKAWNN